MKTKNVKITLAMLVRMQKTVVVEVPEDFAEWDEDKQDIALRSLYESVSDDDWIDDESWGNEEGTHSLDGDTEQPAVFKINKDATVSYILSAKRW